MRNTMLSLLNLMLATNTAVSTTSAVRTGDSFPTICMAQFIVMKISTMCQGFFGLLIVEVEVLSVSKLIFTLANKQKAVRQIVGRDDLHFMGFGWYAFKTLRYLGFYNGY